MKFNKLYNLILESIISLGRLYRLKLLQKKYPNYKTNKQQQSFIDYDLQWLQANFDNKTGDLICKFLANKSLTYLDAQDPEIQKVVQILKLQPSIDIQTFNGTMQLFIKKYLDVINKAQEKALSKSIKYLDTIPLFTLKKVYDNGVVIYRVLDSEKARDAVRKIIDLQWGESANPWCIASRAGSGLKYNYDNYWLNYIDYPKHIAFQNGKLLAFCANDTKLIAWWDRVDNRHNKLPLLDGTEMQTPQYLWTKEEKIKVWALAHGLIFNEKTGLWDCNEDKDIYIHNEDLIDGHLPIKFGKIKGDFVCRNCNELISREGLPIKIMGDLDLDGCINMPGYDLYIKKQFIKENKLIYNLQTQRYDCKGSVEIDDNEVYQGHPLVKFGVISGDFICTNNDELITLDDEYAPTLIKGYCSICYCDKLESIGNLLDRVEGYVNWNNSPKLKIQVSDKFLATNFVKKHKLELNKKTGLWDASERDKIIHVYNDDLIDGHVPVKMGLIDGSFSLQECPSLTSLLNTPQKIVGDLIIRRCLNLTSLEHFPKIITPRVSWDEIEIKLCPKLLNLRGMSDIQDSALRILDCDNLTSLIGCQKIKSFCCIGCKSLTTLEGGPTEVKTYYRVEECENLTSLKGAPQKVTYFSCTDCSKLRSLQYGPTDVNGSYYCLKTGITNLIGAPKKLKNDFKCKQCKNLTSLLGGPEEVGGDYNCGQCPKLTSLQYAPKVIGGYMLCSGCRKLVITNEDWKKYSFKMSKKK